MRRAGLLIAGCLLASGTGLALASPASASVGDRHGHRHDSHCRHGYYVDDYPYWHRHRHHHGLLSVNIGIGINL